MAFLELEKDKLLGLSKEQLEELVARLAEAEVVARGGSVCDVRWSGSIDAPDGGVDVRVDVSVRDFTGDFIPRPKTILQVKRSKMPPADIKDEMCPNGDLAESISEQAHNSGAYLIVSLADDCAEPEYRRRLRGMVEAIAECPNRELLHVDFYDRSKLHQWLRQHPSVMLWVRHALGMPLSGWRPYGAWSNPPVGKDDSFIFASGVSVSTPTDPDRKLSIEEALPVVRNLVRTTQKSVRITGLSGVGKTRFVQALFDETLGDEPLDRTLAVYADLGERLDPTAGALIEQFLAEKRDAIVVLDNCPPEVHASLTSRLGTTAHGIRLMTVEYDIRDGSPQTTDVVYVEAEGPEIAEQLLLRRYPGLGQVNARKVAEFANGNARIALAVAERVEEGESLALLSDLQLFDRLFEQRRGRDGDLRGLAEALALVYSFSVEDDEDGSNELQIIGRLCGSDFRKMYRTIVELQKRQVMQSRGRWRAVLPQAIANRLASDGLSNIPLELIRSTFEQPSRKRLLLSFGHRLGLLHENPIAKKVVQSWLSRSGLLSPILSLDDDRSKLLEYVAPVSPELVLERLEVEAMGANFQGLERNFYHQLGSVVSRLLCAFAYEPELFKRCIHLQYRLGELSGDKDVGEQIAVFFQAYLSGTRASPEEREIVLRQFIWSKIEAQRSLGLKMLVATLCFGHWTGSSIHEFGARPRDYGYHPNHHELLDWYQRFIRVVEDAASGDDHELSDAVRKIFADTFRGLWSIADLRQKLIDTANNFNELEEWTAGWLAVRTILHYDYRSTTDLGGADSIPKELQELEEELRPRNLLSKIGAHVLNNGHHHSALDDGFDISSENRHSESRVRLSEVARELGRLFATSDHSISAIGERLFDENWNPNLFPFGEGLAEGAPDKQLAWLSLCRELDNMDDRSYNFQVMCGYITKLAQIDYVLSRSILDDCLENSKLRQIVIGLHPRRGFNENDLDRCLAALSYEDVDPRFCGGMLWDKELEHLPTVRMAEFACAVLEKAGGDRVLMEALSMKLHGSKSSDDVLGFDLRRLGLIGAKKMLNAGRPDFQGVDDHNIASVLRTCLAFPGNEREKREWLDALFEIVDTRFGHLHGFADSVCATAEAITEDFLDRVFDCDEATRRTRFVFLSRRAYQRLPLSGVESDRLINWCKMKGDESLYRQIAECVYPFRSEREEKNFEFSELAIRFLESAPDANHVLHRYARFVQPTSLIGRLSQSMEKRLRPFEDLGKHDNPAVAAAARKIVVDMKISIESEREKEKREDDARERSFE